MKETAAHKITLYVSDMDGTLLGNDSLISPTSVDLLNSVIAQGALFTVATARTPATVVPLMSKINTVLPFICLNGAALWDNSIHDFCKVNVLREELVQTIADVYERHGLCPFIYRRHGNVIYAHHWGEMSPQEKLFVEERQGLELKKFFLNERDYRHSDDEALLIFSMQDYEKLRFVYEEIKDCIDCSPVFYHDIFDNKSGILEVYASGVSKAHAVSDLMQETKASRLVTFGDNLNDIPMMKVADWGVAVENAFDEVKVAACEVIEPNYADAVPHYILSHFQKVL